MVTLNNYLIPIFPTISHIAKTPIIVEKIVKRDGWREWASGKICEVAK